jgi:hypothetical protein
VAARAALRSYMRHWSQTRWAAGWLTDLEHALVLLGKDFHAGAFAWLVENAGGWWTWDETQLGQRFVDGTYDELLQHAGSHTAQNASDATS